MNIFDLNSLKSQEAADAFERHEVMVAEYMALLSEGYCLQIGVSYGKDSSATLNGGLDAMKRAIASGIIKSDHPIVLMTVDTLQEIEPIQAYVPYAQSKLSEYAKAQNINAIVETVSPPVYQELMILYAGAQKLPASSMSGRHADCSIIWKVDTGIRALKRIKSQLPEEYVNSVWISASGSRTSESTSRRINMQKQGIQNYKSQDLIANVKSCEAKGKVGGVYKFAPIEDWKDHEVINYLLHAGDNPVMPSLVNQRIPAYCENFALLIAIYGEGSNDTCEVVSIDSENKAEQKGCGKIARFGCVTCLQTSQDHSALEIKKGIRWSRFGDATQRFRDYLMRISVDVKYRAFHARAFDPACNNNVFLQPNVLKASVLEKMVWYASMITVESREIFEQAVIAKNNGEIDNDVGVIDIMNDPTLSASAKLQYKEMYIERLTEKPMFEMFTQKHAVLLSLMWSLHGVATLPYRPVAILDAVKKGKRIPFPLMNSEINANNAKLGLMSWDHKSNMNRTIPDALVAQVFVPAKKSFTDLLNTHKGELNETHLQSFMPFSIADFHTKKDVQFDAVGASFNHITTSAKETRKFKLTYTINNDNADEKIKAVDSATGKAIPVSKNDALYQELLTLGRKDFSDELDRTDNIDMLYGEGEQTVTANHEFNHQKTFTSDVVFATNDLRKKKEAPKHFSSRKREYDKSLGRFVAKRASLKVYKSSTTPALEVQAKQAVSYWLPEFTKTRNASIDTHNAHFLDDTQLKQSFIFDDYIFDVWLSQGGWERLVADHNIVLKSRIAKRQPLRLFSGTNPVYYLTTNTGLTTTDHFYEYMQTTLKRTEVFEQANLFSIAGLSYEKIKSISFVVDMDTHRSQKVQHLLAMRYLRNQRRVFIKTTMNNKTLSPSKHLQQAVSNVSVRMNEFTEQYTQVAKMYLTASAFSSFSTSPLVRKSLLQIWLDEFNDIIINIESAFKLLATKDELTAINGDYDAKLAVTKMHSASVATLVKEVNAFAKIGIDKANTMNKVVESELKVVNGHHEAFGQSATAIDSMANWIVANYKGVNAFILGSGLTQNRAYEHKLPYVCPVFKENPKSNTTEKINKRAVRAIDDMNNFIKALTMSDNAFAAYFSGIDSKAQTRKSVSAMSTKAKTAKLLALMSGKPSTTVTNNVRAA